MASRDAVRPLEMTASQGCQENVPPEKRQKPEARLLVKRLSGHAYLPARGAEGAAGYDLARHAVAHIYET